MTRILPHPLLTLLVSASWLLLNVTLDPGHILLALTLGLGIPWLVEPLWPDTLRPREPLTCLRLAARVLVDIILSNIEVARRILGPEAAIHPRFVQYPLTLGNHYGIVTLAGIITMTPGTVTADIAPDRRSLLIHAFNTDDEAALIATIRERYETPLERIFPC